MSKEFLNHENASHEYANVRSATSGRPSYTDGANGISTKYMVSSKLAKANLKSSKVIYDWPLSTESEGSQAKKMLLRSMPANSSSTTATNILAVLSKYTVEYAFSHNFKLPFLFQGMNLTDLAGFTVNVDGNNNRHIQSNLFSFGNLKIWSTFLNLNQDGTVDFIKDITVSATESGLVNPGDVKMHVNVDGVSSDQCTIFNDRAKNIAYMKPFLNQYGYSKNVNSPGSVVLDALILCLFTTPCVSRVTVSSWDTQPYQAQGNNIHIISDKILYAYDVVIRSIISKLGITVPANGLDLPLDDVIALIFTWFANNSNTGCAQFFTLTGSNNLEVVVAEDPVYNVSGLKLIIPADIASIRKDNRLLANAVYEGIIPEGYTPVTINGITYIPLRAATADTTAVYAEVDANGRLMYYFDTLLDLSDPGELSDDGTYYIKDFSGYELMQMHVRGIETLRCASVESLSDLENVTVQEIYGCNADSDSHDSLGQTQYTRIGNVTQALSNLSLTNRKWFWPSSGNLGIWFNADGRLTDDDGRGVDLPSTNNARLKVDWSNYINPYGNSNVGLALKQEIAYKGSELQGTITIKGSSLQYMLEHDARVFIGNASNNMIDQAWYSNSYRDIWYALISSLEDQGYVTINENRTEMVIDVRGLFRIGQGYLPQTNTLRIGLWMTLERDTQGHNSQTTYINAINIDVCEPGAQAQLLVNTCKPDFAFDQRRLIGSLERPWALLAVLFTSSITQASKEYANKLSANKLRSVLSAVGLRALSAEPFTEIELARLFYLCQDQEELLTPEYIEGMSSSQVTALRAGLVTETSILRELIVNSKTVRATRTSKLLEALDNALMNFKTKFTPEDLKVPAIWFGDTKYYKSHYDDNRSKWVWDDGSEHYCYSVNEICAPGDPLYNGSNEEVGFVFDVENQSNGSVITDTQDQLDEDEISNMADEVVEVDDQFAIDNPDMASSVYVEGNVHKIHLGELLKYAKGYNACIASDMITPEVEAYVESLHISDGEGGYITDPNQLPLLTVFEIYAKLNDKHESMSEQETLVYEWSSAVVKNTRNMLSNEWSTLTADAYTAALEDAIDAVDDTITSYDEDAKSVISNKIDAIVSQFTNFDAALTQRSTDIKDRFSVLTNEASDRIASMKDAFISKASQVATDAKTFYENKIQALKEEAEDSSLPFSLDALVSKVKSYAGNLSDFLVDATGMGALSNAETGWQDSAAFTNTSTISAVCGVAQSGLKAAVSTAFALIGKVGSALASNVKKFMYSTFKDGVSYRIRKTGYNTLGLQATSLVIDRSEFENLYPWIWNDLKTYLNGDNSYYNVCQIGPLLMFVQDYSSDQLMITLNPILIPTNDYINTKNDYYLSESMAHSIIYSLAFYNKFVAYMREIRPSYAAYLPYMEVPALSSILADILAKAEGVSAAAAWGLKALILGVGIALGAILCATGYGSVVGIALIAGAVAVGECCTPEPVDKSKVERLKSDNEYANATIMAADMASIWTGHLTPVMAQTLLFIRNKLSNVRITSLINGLQHSTYGTLFHNGTGITMDVVDALNRNGYVAEAQRADEYKYLGFFPTLTKTGTPSFKVMLITDKERFLRQGAQLLAFAVVAGTMTFKAAKAGIAHHRTVKANKIAAKQWSEQQPDISDYQSYQKDANGNVVRDEAGNPVMLTDKAGLAKARAAYNKKQYKYARKYNRLTNSASSTSSTAGLVSYLQDYTTEDSQEPTTDEQVAYIIKKLG